MQGYESANVRELAEGTAVHAEHGRWVSVTSAMRGLAILLFVAALIALVLSFLPSF